MDEYVTALTDFAPQWRISNMLVSQDKGECRKERKMMWCLLLTWAPTELEENGKRWTGSGKLRSLGGLKILSIKILQSTNDLPSQNFFAQGRIRSQKSSGGGGKDADATQLSLRSRMLKAADPVFSTLPKEGEISIDACLIDPSKHATLKEQDAFYVRPPIVYPRLCNPNPNPVFPSQIDRMQRCSRCATLPTFMSSKS